MPCSNCKFSVTTAKAGVVSCKRFPPVINPSNPCVPPQSVFPTLAGSDACGEYQMVAQARMEVRYHEPDITPPPPPKRGFFGRLVGR